MSAQIVPYDYTVPPFPSLYQPVRPLTGDAKYLFYTRDVWRFTLFWTLLFYTATHILVALCAVAMQWRNWKIVCGVSVVYAVIAGLQALFAGSVVGLVIGVVYEAASFKMSTWIPFIWAVICTLVLIISSFSIQGGL